jgi:uncharacterized protein (TIGR02996 family)
MPEPSAEEAGFLEAIREHPDDDGPRLVYADWLDERGEARGEFIRTHCLLGHLGHLPLDPEYGWDREVRGFRRAVEDWLRPIPPGMAVWLERGLPVAELSLNQMLLPEQTASADQTDHPGILAWLIHLRIDCRYLEALDELHTGVSSLQLWRPVLPPCQIDLTGFRAGDQVLITLCTLSRLTTLRLNDCRSVSDHGVAVLADCGELTDLSLIGARLTDAGLAHLAGLSRLRSLSLRDTAVTDAGLAHLTGLRRLRRLDLRGTHVTLAGVEQFRRTLPDCRLDCDPAADPRLRRLHAWRGLEPGW